MNMFPTHTLVTMAKKIKPSFEAAQQKAIIHAKYKNFQELYNTILKNSQKPLNFTQALNKYVMAIAHDAFEFGKEKLDMSAKHVLEAMSGLMYSRFVKTGLNLGKLVRFLINSSIDNNRFIGLMIVIGDKVTLSNSGLILKQLSKDKSPSIRLAVANFASKKLLNEMQKVEKNAQVKDIINRRLLLEL
ncbi:hypothetical protein ACFL3T_01910 [Patescibacteria group bacterium]